MLTNLAQNVWGSDPLALPAPFGIEVAQFGGVVLSKQSLLVMGATGLVLALQWWLFRSTLVGRRCGPWPTGPRWPG